MSAAQLPAEAFCHCGFVCGDAPVYDIADNLAGKVTACWLNRREGDITRHRRALRLRRNPGYRASSFLAHCAY